MFTTLLLFPRYHLADHEKLDLNPSMHWPAPILIHSPSNDRGPVLVTVEYRIPPEHAGDFVKAMEQRRWLLMRTGAFRWGLFNDTEDETRFIETFLTESWAEHLRQHKRVTITDRDVESAIDAFHTGPEKPLIRHLIYTDLHSLHGFKPPV